MKLDSSTVHQLMSFSMRAGQVCLVVGAVLALFRLSGHLDWPWVWVTLPFWLPVLLVFLLACMLGIALVVKGAQVQRR